MKRHHANSRWWISREPERWLAARLVTWGGVFMLNGIWIIRMGRRGGIDAYGWQLNTVVSFCGNSYINRSSRTSVRFRLCLPAHHTWKSLWFQSLSDWLAEDSCSRWNRRIHTAERIAFICSRRVPKYFCRFHKSPQEDTLHHSEAQLQPWQENLHTAVPALCDTYVLCLRAHVHVPDTDEKSHLFLPVSIMVLDLGRFKVPFLSELDHQCKGGTTPVQQRILKESVIST